MIFKVLDLNFDGFFDFLEAYTAIEDQFLHEWSQLPCVLCNNCLVDTDRCHHVLLLSLDGHDCVLQIHKTLVGEAIVLTHVGKPLGLWEPLPPLFFEPIGKGHGLILHMVG